MTLYQIPGIMNLIRTELPADVKDKSLVTKMENLFITSFKQEYLTDTQRNSEELVDRIWLYASLLDAALSKKAKYAPEKYDCEKEWEPAVRWLKFELNKKKLLSGVMIHDVAKLCSMASASMDCLDPDSCGQSLVGWVQKYGESLTDLYAVTIEVKRHLDELAETFEKYQLSLMAD